MRAYLYAEKYGHLVRYSLYFVTPELETNAEASWSVVSYFKTLLHFETQAKISNSRVTLLSARYNFCHLQDGSVMFDDIQFLDGRTLKKDYGICLEDSKQ